MQSKIKEPAVSRRTLVLTAAAIWSLVGAMLAMRAIVWLVQSGTENPWLVPLSIGIGVLKGWLVLGKMAKRNVQRIRALSPHKEKICVFAFQSTQAFLLVLGMIGLGIGLRHAPLSRDVLIAIYMAIGMALAVGSLSYWRSRMV